MARAAIALALVAMLAFAVSSGKAIIICSYILLITLLDRLAAAVRASGDCSYRPVTLHRASFGSF
jgi:hypothetical protein